VPQDTAATAVELQLQEIDTVVRMTPIRRRARILIALGEFLDGYDLISIVGALLLLHSRFSAKPAVVILIGRRSLPEATFGFQGIFLAPAVCGVMLGVYALTGLKFEPRGRDLDELAPAMYAADAPCAFRRIIEQQQ